MKSLMPKAPKGQTAYHLNTVSVTQTVILVEVELESQEEDEEVDDEVQSEEGDGADMDAGAHVFVHEDEVSEFRKLTEEFGFRPILDFLGETKKTPGTEIS